MVGKVIVEQDASDITVLSIDNNTTAKMRYGVEYHTTLVRLLVREDIFKKSVGLGLFKCISPLHSETDTYFVKNYYKTRKSVKKAPRMVLKDGSNGVVVEFSIRSFKVPPGTYNPVQIHIKPYIMFKSTGVYYRNWDSHPTPNYCLEIGGVGTFDRSSELLQ